MSSQPSFEQVLHASGAPPPTDISPRCLKTAIQSLLEFAAQEAPAAILIAKLPSGQVWRDMLQTYNSQAESTIYSLHSQPTSPDPAPSLIPLAISRELWRGAYFLLLLCKDWGLALVAQRQAPPTDALPQTPPPLRLHTATLLHPQGLRSLLQVAAQAPDFPPDLISSWQARLGSSQGMPWDLQQRWLSRQLQIQQQLEQSAATYRKQALVASELSSQNALLLSTLQLKDSFLNSVGQELRTPLSSIKTALTLLGSPSIKASQRQRYLDLIDRECDRQSALISGVLNLLQLEASAETVQPENVYLGQTVPPLVSTYQPLAQEKGIMLAYTIAKDLPAVACCDSWVRQIVIQLLNNAIKYTASGGRVWVTAKALSDAVELEVRDTGTGMAPAEVSRIFDHFYRGRNQPADQIEGAGLGLSIVQQLLMYCGGTVLVNSQPERGSRLRVRLPVHGR